MNRFIALTLLVPGLAAAQAVAPGGAAEGKGLKPAETRAVAVGDPSCGGFGITIPLFSVRYHENGDAYVNGPVKAGLGGGYFWGRCDSARTWTHGPEVFAYTEGLDPTGMFQIGLAAGYQVAAFGKFQFGLAAGYDLIRQQTGTGTNGLLAAKRMGQESLSFLITFSVSGGVATAEPEKKPAEASGAGGSGGGPK